MKVKDLCVPELEEPRGAASIGMDIAAETAFQTCLRDQEIEIDACLARSFPDAAHHLGREALPGDHSAKLRADGHGRVAIVAGTSLLGPRLYGG